MGGKQVRDEQAMGRQWAAHRGAPDAACSWRGFLATFTGQVVLLFGFVHSHRAPLQMYWVDTAKGHNGPRAISTIMKRELIVLCS